uniref:Uncharacterized protein n=1 Tax=Parastrongyloides trichosuri TaxID=131310 RepID=A0A0N5A6M1_PARTI
MKNMTNDMQLSSTPVVPKVEPLVKTESIYLLFDSKTWDKRIIQLNIIILLGFLSYIFCICYVIIIKLSNYHIYKYKPELVYEIRTTDTDIYTYKSIFSPKDRLAYYTKGKKIFDSKISDINTSTNIQLPSKPKSNEPKGGALQFATAIEP